jgi:hypothetical protein
MKTIIGRLRRLEIGAGVIETAGSRRNAELAEILTRRIAAGRARVGLPEATVESREDVSGLTCVEILQRGRLLAREASIEAKQRYR